MSKIFKVSDRNAFRHLRDKSWDANAEDWIIKRDLPLKLKEELYSRIKDFSSKESNSSLLVDLGCGNAWLYSLLIEREVTNVKYIGYDINSLFIEDNSRKFKDAKFHVADLEIRDSIKIKNKTESRLFVSCLSLIEMLDLDTVFFNIRSNVVKGNRLLIVVLEPFVEILRLSISFNEFKKNLLTYYSDETTYYRKPLALSKKSVKKQSYVGVLHSSEKYVEFATKNDLKFLKCDEINTLNSDFSEGTIYKILEFKL